eukprot:13863964-Ditylum_brightwellii.AAC.1
MVHHAIEFNSCNSNNKPVSNSIRQMEIALWFLDCGNPGHCANDCPKNQGASNTGGRRGSNHLMFGIQLSQKQQDNVIDSSWFLLDTCSTGSVSNNWSLVMNIQPCFEDDKL